MNLKKYGIVSTKYSIFMGCSLIIFAVFCLAGCWGNASKQSDSQVLEAQKHLVVINVLEPSYFQDCHIKGSINIPFEQFEEKMKAMAKQDRYVIYCSTYTCTAAPFSAGLMKDAGFEDVAVLPGGVVEWYQKGLPCQGPCTMQYLKESNEKLDDEAHAGIQIVTPEELQLQMQNAHLL